MSDVIWKFADEVPSQEAPYEILKEYARKLGPDTGEIFHANILQTFREDGGVICAFYLIVPRLKNYSYKLMQMTQKDLFSPYPVEMLLYGRAEGNLVHDKAENSFQFRNKLEIFITHPLTQLILTALRTQIEIFEDYQKEK